MMDDPLLADYNVERRASDFADACQVRTLKFTPLVVSSCFFVCVWFAVSKACMFPST